MHNYGRRVDGSNLSKKSHRQSIEHAVSYDMNSLWVSAEGWEPNTQDGSITVMVPPSATNPAGWYMPAADQFPVSMYCRRHLEWRDGRVYVIPHFMYSVNTGNVVIGVEVDAWEAGTAMPVIGTAAAQEKTITVPSTAMSIQRLKDSDFLNNSGWTTTVNEKDYGIVITVWRDGDNASDTCTGYALFLGAEIRYLEGNRSLGQKFDAYRRY